MKSKRHTKFILGIGALLLSYNAVNAQQTGTANQPIPGQLWGLAFGDYAYVPHGDSAGRGNGNVQYKGLGSAASPTQNANAIEIRRAYLGYDYVINKKFSATALLAYEGNADANNNRTFYLKNIYVTWKNIFKNSDLIIGQQFTPSFATTNNIDALWGYRSIERSLLDMRKVDASTDMGISLAGRIWSADTSELSSFVGYRAMLGDNSSNTPVPAFTGAGTSPNSTTDKDKKFRLNIYYSSIKNKLTIGIYGDFINDGPVFYKTAKGYQNSTATLKGYAAYNAKLFGIGAEYFEQINTNGEVETFKTDPKSNDTLSAVQSGFSIFGHVTLIPNKLNFFARYDYYNPDTKYKYTTSENFTNRLVPQNTYTETFITAGLDWTPTDDKKVHIMPNIWYDAITNGYGSDKLKSDYYLVPRITFYFIFKQ
jgi:hypothetical protein